MYEFIKLFLSNFVTASLEPSVSLVPTTTSLSATRTSYLGTNLILDGDDSETTLGTTITSIGTSSLNNCNSAYETTLEDLKTTQAYIESLNEEELSEMIAKLELKDVELSIQESEEQCNTFQKTKRL